MTVSTESNKIEYVGNGITTLFPYDFLVIDEDHMVVYFDDVIQTSGYTLTGVLDPEGGDVTFSVAPPSGTVVTLLRVVPNTQEISYPVQGPFPSKTHERGLDLGVMRVQQLEEQVSRALVVPIGGDKYDARGNRIINVGSAVDPTDATNVQDVVDIINQSSVSGGSVISDTPPNPPINGLRWTRCSDMISFIWYEDGDSGQWVEDNPSMGGTSVVQLATFENEQEAIAGGLAQDTLYKTSTGEVRIKL